MNTELRSSTIKRFWDNTEVKSDNECWNYKSKSKKYPFCGACPAYYVSWVIHYGSLPKVVSDRKVVLRHLCHNKKCVNPHHLAPGTHSDNQLDRFVRKVDTNSIYVARRLRTTHRLTYEEIGNIIGTSVSNARIVVLGIGPYSNI